VVSEGDVLTGLAAFAEFGVIGSGDVPEVVGIAGQARADVVDLHYVERRKRFVEFIDAYGWGAVAIGRKWERDWLIFKEAAHPAGECQGADHED
jgi:hypothetical protein